MEHRDLIMKQLECLLAYARMNGANENLMAVLEIQVGHVREQVSRWAHEQQRLAEARAKQPDWEMLWAEAKEELEEIQERSLQIRLTRD